MSYGKAQLQRRIALSQSLRTFLRDQRTASGADPRAVSLDAAQIVQVNGPCSSPFTAGGFLGRVVLLDDLLTQKGVGVFRHAGAERYAEDPLCGVLLLPEESVRLCCLVKASSIRQKHATVMDSDGVFTLPIATIEVVGCNRQAVDFLLQPTIYLLSLGAHRDCSRDHDRR